MRIKDEDEIRNCVQKLQKITINTPEYFAIKTAFERLLHQCRAGNTARRVDEVYGLAILGQSGSGKTSTLRRVRQQAEKTLDLKPHEVVSFAVQSPASIKGVGAAALDALGYPLRANRTAFAIWQKVRDLLRENRTLVLVVDEAQDIIRNQSTREMQDVVSTLKTLMQIEGWPVSIILMGVPHLPNGPGLLDLLHYDRQLARRLRPIEFSSLSLETFAQDAPVLISKYAALAEVPISNSLYADQFVERLIYAGHRQLGVTLELIIEALGFAMRNGKPLCREHFREAYRHRTGAVDALNPFVTDNFRRVDPSKLLDAPEHPDGGGTSK
ncbi:ATP-binding protein [Celeribacter sp. ULVN23_4]